MTKHIRAPAGQTSEFRAYDFVSNLLVTVACVSLAWPFIYAQMLQIVGEARLLQAKTGMIKWDIFLGKDEVPGSNPGSSSIF